MFLSFISKILCFFACIVCFSFSGSFLHFLAFCFLYFLFVSFVFLVSFYFDHLSSVLFFCLFSFSITVIIAFYIWFYFSACFIFLVMSWLVGCFSPARGWVLAYRVEVVSPGFWTSREFPGPGNINWCGISQRSPSQHQDLAPPNSLQATVEDASH